MDAIQAAYMSCADRLGGMGIADFREAVKSCDVHPVIVQGGIAGAMIAKGPEVHACILPWAHKRWVGRAQVRILNEIIKAHGYATTSATTEAGRRFVERLGFKKTPQGYRKEVMYGR